MRIVFLSVLIVLGCVSLARADSHGEVSNDHNTSFIRAFEIVSSIRYLKADLGVLPSSDAKTALLLDLPRR
jgi:hypothetical protein